MHMSSSRDQSTNSKFPLSRFPKYKLIQINKHITASIVENIVNKQNILGIREIGVTSREELTQDQVP